MANFRELLYRLKEEYPTVVNRGKEFEKICKWFLENDPTYADTFKDVWLWYDWPNREKNGFGQDIGIDLVGETHTGKLWAIQAKCYIDTQISTDDITSFLSFSGNKIFTNRLLICTGEISKIGMVHISNQDKPVQTLFSSDLNKSPVNWFDSVSIPIAGKEEVSATTSFSSGEEAKGVNREKLIDKFAKETGLSADDIREHIDDFNFSDQQVDNFLKGKANDSFIIKAQEAHKNRNLAADRTREKAEEYLQAFKSPEEYKKDTLNNPNADNMSVEHATDEARRVLAFWHENKEHLKNSKLHNAINIKMEEYIEAGANFDELVKEIDEMERQVILGDPDKMKEFHDKNELARRIERAEGYKHHKKLRQAMKNAHADRSADENGKVIHNRMDHVGEHEQVSSEDAGIEHSDSETPHLGILNDEGDIDEKAQELYNNLHEAKLNRGNVPEGAKEQEKFDNAEAEFRNHLKKLGVDDSIIANAIKHKNLGKRAVHNEGEFNQENEADHKNTEELGGKPTPTEEERKDGKAGQTRTVPDLAAAEWLKKSKKQIWVAGRGKGWIDADKMDGKNKATANNMKVADKSNGGKMIIYPQEAEGNPFKGAMAGHGGNWHSIETDNPASGHSDYGGLSGEDFIAHHLGNKLKDHEGMKGNVAFEVNASDYGFGKSEHPAVNRREPKKEGWRSQFFGEQAQARAAYTSEGKEFKRALDWLQRVGTNIQPALKRLAEASRESRHGKYKNKFKPDAQGRASVMGEAFRYVPNLFTPKKIQRLHEREDRNDKASAVAKLKEHTRKEDEELDKY